MDRLSPAYLAGQPVATNHTGVNFIFTQDQTAGTFGARADLVGADLVRYPGGNVTELYFDPANPNADFVEIPDGAGGTLAEHVEPLDEFLDYLAVTGKQGLFVIPIERYVQGALAEGVEPTNAIDPVSELAIQCYVRQVLESDGRALGFEIGNEFNVWANLASDEYGQIAGKVAVVVKAEVNAFEAEGNLPEGYASPLISMVMTPYYLQQDDDGDGVATHEEAVQEMIDAMTPEGIDAIDAVSMHRYIRGPYENINGFDAPWDNFDLHEALLGKDVAFIVSEWNIGGDQLGIRDWETATEAERDGIDTGLKHAGAITSLFHELVTQDVDIATIWTLQQGNKVGLADREGSGEVNDLRAGGEIFAILAANTQGMTPIVLNRPDASYDIHGFADQDAQLLVINGRIAEAQTLQIDMRALLGPTGEAELQILGVAPGDDPRDPAVEPVLSEGDAYVTLEDGIFTLSIEPYEVVVLKVEAGADVLDAETIQGVVFGGNGADHIIGSNRDDRLDGGLHDDVIEGGAGSDRLGGGGGNDLLRGGGEKDSIQGGQGDDILLGGNGVDRLFAQEGNDYLDGGDSRDLLYGGAGDDTLDGGAGHDIFLGGEGADQFQVQAEDSAWREQILDFNAAEDQIVLGLEGLDIADLFLSQDESAVIIRFSGGSLYVEGAELEDFDETNLIVG